MSALRDAIELERGEILAARAGDRTIRRLSGQTAATCIHEAAHAAHYHTSGRATLTLVDGLGALTLASVSPYFGGIAEAVCSLIGEYASYRLVLGTDTLPTLAELVECEEWWQEEGPDFDEYEPDQAAAIGAMRGYIAGLPHYTLERAYDLVCESVRDDYERLAGAIFALAERLLEGEPVSGEEAATIIDTAL